MTFTTQTGSFPIGFRRGWSDWQKDLPSLLGWAHDHDFSVVDLGASLADISQAAREGFRVGSADLPERQSLFSSDPAQRAEAVSKNSEFIESAAQAGVRNFFLVVLSADPSLPRRENFEFATESLGALVPTLEKVGASVVLEGYPGAGALCCTPETVRALFERIPSPSIGLNYDPSHLVRMGINPIRFLKEFAPRVHHVHGKDCEIRSDDLYEYGWEQPATFKPNPAFGAAMWRYTIPGRGNTNWREVLQILTESGYQGAVSIELEDCHFNGTTQGEQRGLLESATFLSHS